MSNLKYSLDGRCVFDESNHSYFIGNKKLLGVTSYIAKYKNKFDALAVATKYVKKHGGDVEELMKKWELEGQLSLKNGSAVHKVFEDYINFREVILQGVSDKEKVAVKFIEEIFMEKRLTPVCCELVVYDEDLGLASMIDCVAKNSDEEYFILDWKTNKNIERNGYGKFMLDKFNSYPDSTFYHYSLQLSLYERMYKEHKIKGKYIIHIDNEDYKIIEAETINIK